LASKVHSLIQGSNYLVCRGDPELGMPKFQLVDGIFSGLPSQILTRNPWAAKYPALFAYIFSATLVLKSHLSL
jgi:hypothetical protein